jgi:hypothetical protein
MSRSTTQKKKPLLDLRSMCRAYTETHIKSLAAIASNKDNPPDVQMRAIAMLLERGWGRPQQELKTDSEIRVTIRKMLGDDV